MQSALDMLMSMRYTNLRFIIIIIIICGIRSTWNDEAEVKSSKVHDNKQDRFWYVDNSRLEEWRLGLVVASRKPLTG